VGHFCDCATSYSEKGIAQSVYRLDLGLDGREVGFDSLRGKEIFSSQ
jgi:hypothetical protein